MGVKYMGWGANIRPLLCRYRMTNTQLFLLFFLCLSGFGDTFMPCGLDLNSRITEAGLGLTFFLSLLTKFWDSKCALHLICEAVKPFSRDIFVQELVP